MSRSIDCVVVGYNDTDFGDLLRRNEPFKDVSGGYRHLLANSVLFKGNRLKYFDLLNAVRNDDGTRGCLHVAKMPNLAMCYLTSYLAQRGLQVEYVNFFNDDKDHFRDLLNESPRTVAITTTFYFEAAPIREIVDFVKRYSPRTKVVVGGPHIYNVCTDNPAAYQDVLFQEMGADVFVYDSQGEQTLASLCTALRESSDDLRAIPNLIVRKSDNVFGRSARVIEHNDINANAIKWSSFDSSLLKPTAQTRTARSCAYNCAFCRYPVMAGALELMSLEVIERELDSLHDAGVRHLLFIDDTFNVPVKRFKDICRLLIRKSYSFKWFSYFRCANADQECFDLMTEAGCVGVFLGIESGDDGVLKSMNKVASVAKYTEGIRELNSRGILTYASFIIGYPTETEDSAKRTLDFIEATRPTFYCLESFFYDPKVPVAIRAADYGLTGAGYAWRHNTMDWRRASEIVEHGYRAISNSIVVPLYGFDLWSVAYLLGQGLSRESIFEFLRLASKLLIDGIHLEREECSVNEQELRNVFRASSS